MIEPAGKITLKSQDARYLLGSKYNSRCRYILERYNVLNDIKADGNYIETGHWFTLTAEVKGWIWWPLFPVFLIWQVFDSLWDGGLKKFEVPSKWVSQEEIGSWSDRAWPVYNEVWSKLSKNIKLRQEKDNAVIFK